MAATPRVDPALLKWRKRIDALNRQMLVLLNRRTRCAKAIGRIKHGLGLPITDPLREKTILRRLVALNKGPLDTRAVLAVFGAVIRETRRIERRSSLEQNPAAGQTRRRRG